MGGGLSKTCRVPGCSKGARGSSSLCIAHGGAPRCHKPYCQRVAEGRTTYCKAHDGGLRREECSIDSTEGRMDNCIAQPDYIGGPHHTDMGLCSNTNRNSSFQASWVSSKTCQVMGCGKGARGASGLCIAHGGGQRCSQEGCSRVARGKTGLCIRHGGGKRCTLPECTRSAEGQSGLCISHGGGRRCEQPKCGKGAQGRTRFCKAHGGGNRYSGATQIGLWRSRM